MNENDESPHKISLLFLALGIAVLIAFPIHLYLTRQVQHLVVEDLRMIPSEIPISSLSEIWFASSDQLFATFEPQFSKDGSQHSALAIVSWSFKNRDHIKSVVHTIDFSQLVQAPPGGLQLANSFHGGASRGDTEISGDRLLAYAVSNDGATVAWAWEGELFLGVSDSIGKHPEIKSWPLDQQEPVISLSQVGQNKIAAVQGNDVTVWDISAKTLTRVWRTSVLDGGSCLLWSRGAFRGMSSFRTSDAWRLGIRPVKLRNRLGVDLVQARASRTGRCIAVSKHGQVLIGTREGLVVAPQETGFSRCAAIETSNGINSLAFYDEDLAIAAGEGAGLSLVEDAHVVTKLADAPQAVLLVAASRSHLAYATAGILALAELHWRWWVGDSARFELAIMFSSIGLLAFLRASVIDLVALLNKRRKARAANRESSRKKAAPK